MATTHEKQIVRAQETGAAALAFTLTDATQDIEIQSVELHLDAAAATSENFTITRSDVNNSEYNTLLFTQDMNTETDIAITDDDAKFLVMAGDSLVFAFTNSDTNDFGLTIKYHRLPVRGGTRA